MPDMRELLEIARADSPRPRFGVDEIVAAGRRHRRWRTTRVIGGAGVVGTAVVTGLVLVASNLALSGGAIAPVQRPAPPAAPAPAVEVPPFTFTFDAYRVGDFRVLTPVEVTRTYQLASIVTDVRVSGRQTTAFAGSLTVYRPGVAPPAEFTSGTRLTVKGRDAYQGQVERDPLAGLDRYGVPTTRELTPSQVLAWQYADNAWAVIASDPLEQGAKKLTPAAALALAERFAMGVSVPARLPFRVGQLPSGYALVSVHGRGFDHLDTGSVRVTYAPPAAGSNRPATDKSPRLEITIGQQDVPPPDAPKPRPRCGDSVLGHWCAWAIPGTRFYLHLADRSRTLSTQELTRIGRALTFADLEHPDTWHPVP